jgi:hypothetical protein
LDADERQQGLERGRMTHTAALFAAYALLNEIVDAERPSVKFKRKARAVLEAFPTRLDLMRLAESTPLLDAEEAQRLTTRLERLPIATDAAIPSPLM